MQAKLGIGLGTHPGYWRTWITGVTWHSSLLLDFKSPTDETINQFIFQSIHFLLSSIVENDLNPPVFDSADINCWALSIHATAVAIKNVLHMTHTLWSSSHYNQIGHNFLFLNSFFIHFSTTITERNTNKRFETMTWNERTMKSSSGKSNVWSVEKSLS